MKERKKGFRGRADGMNRGNDTLSNIMPFSGYIDEFVGSSANTAAVADGERSLLFF